MDAGANVSTLSTTAASTAGWVTMPSDASDALSTLGLIKTFLSLRSRGNRSNARSMDARTVS
jgi:hypothetical protein